MVIREGSLEFRASNGKFDIAVGGSGAITGELRRKYFYDLNIL